MKFIFNKINKWKSKLNYQNKMIKIKFHNNLSHHNKFNRGYKNGILKPSN